MEEEETDNGTKVNRSVNRKRQIKRKQIKRKSQRKRKEKDI